ncbi:MerR family transcriptional regulator [Parabacteroides sp. FAFU027]|uniref:MerR family transcriptional regulator n=1 Tax=Parabacteroides sp. FAFU027 TaxID=2922715 RepID=UPI001FAEE321|nr:MerR family transcriptional regulator [Parabacteroides sp. FAFU027]
MTLIENKNQKLYYSIGEVAEMFGVNESLLRYWEREFDIIRPRKNTKGTRSYRKEDIDNIKLIYHLVKEKGLTLDGAKKKIKDNKDGVTKNHEIITRLQTLKEELLAMKAELDAIE